MGIVMTVVVLGAAVVNIWTQRSEWRVLSSPDIAPGDLVKVSENWVVPCDMAIVKGTTVAEVFDPEKGSKKHTLFAGTHVLSSGRSEEILAIVQTTGAHTTKGQLIQSILFPIPMRCKYNEHLKVGIFCFDKTGTLTMHCLDFLGVQPVNNSRFTPIVDDVKDAPSSEELLYALATCHSVDSLEDCLVGNEVEVRMFTATG
ncbi:P-type ATPase (P-ATPase) Superfamily [Phytophthora palmivora]|uniref:P-type ATPase (P-ATPase) Superfamily n=1 Tax=Phytophthora palmivora TaxID=4796 RepID=A0A2P4XQ28_9STRA|nr:P-type ATPase (P-ATPase) Superfamily [Phytophthora palmivora]